MGLSHGLLQLFGEQESLLSFLTFDLSFFFLVLGDELFELSTDCDRDLLPVLPDLASRLTVHQLLFPELSFWTLTNRLCKDRLCRTEFYKVKRGFMDLCSVHGTMPAEDAHI